MFGRTGSSAGETRPLSVKTDSSCELFKPQDRVFWCSYKACNESGVIETRVGTSSGDPSTASYLITKLSDGSKLEIPGYLLRRSAKYHAYHTRNRSTHSTCSAHTTGANCKNITKIPHERKRRRHASGHPTMHTDTTAKSLGNDNKGKSLQHSILSPPDRNGLELVNSNHEELPGANNPCGCVIRRSNSGMPADAPAATTFTFSIPDADSEEAGPLSTSPSADEGVDLSDAMFSFDDDIVQSPPKNSTQNPFHLRGRQLDQESTSAFVQNRSTSEEETPRTPVAVATYQQTVAISGSSCSGASLFQHHVDTTGRYFSRSQVHRQAEIETVGYDENGTEDLFPSCDDPNYLCGVSQNDAVEQSTPAIVSTRGVFGASFVASLTINENSCGVSDEGIVDNDNDNATVAGRGCQMTTTTTTQLHSPESYGAADVSEDMSDREDGESRKDEVDNDNEQADSRNRAMSVGPKKQHSSTGDTNWTTNSGGGLHGVTSSRKSSRGSENSSCGGGGGGIPGSGSGGGGWSVNSVSTSSSLDQLTSSIAKMKTKLSPCNPCDSGENALARLGVEGRGMPDSTAPSDNYGSCSSAVQLDWTGSEMGAQNRLAVGGSVGGGRSRLSSCSSEGDEETPLAKKTRLQRRNHCYNRSSIEKDASGSSSCSCNHNHKKHSIIPSQ